MISPQRKYSTLKDDPTFSTHAVSTTLSLHWLKLKRFPSGPQDVWASESDRSKSETFSRRSNITLPLCDCLKSRANIRN